MTGLNSHKWSILLQMNDQEDWNETGPRDFRYLDEYTPEVDLPSRLEWWRDALDRLWHPSSAAQAFNYSEKLLRLVTDMLRIEQAARPMIEEIRDRATQILNERIQWHSENPYTDPVEGASKKSKRKRHTNNIPRLYYSQKDFSRIPYGPIDWPTYDDVNGIGSAIASWAFDELAKSDPEGPKLKQPQFCREARRKGAAMPSWAHREWQLTQGIFTGKEHRPRVGNLERDRHLPGLQEQKFYFKPPEEDSEEDEQYNSDDENPFSRLRPGTGRNQPRDEAKIAPDEPAPEVPAQEPPPRARSSPPSGDGRSEPPRRPSPEAAVTSAPEESAEGQTEAERSRKKRKLVAKKPRPTANKRKPTSDKPRARRPQPAQPAPPPRRSRRLKGQDAEYQ
jgi:hypothetical protein